MNLVLIGFKSSGKSTIGEALAKELNKKFIDTDKVVEDIYFKESSNKLSCREIYTKYGSSKLRELELSALASLKSENNSVISTGGGVVVLDNSKEILQSLGVCIFLNVPFSVLEQRLLKTSSPLFASKNILQVYEERYPSYLESAQIVFDVPKDSSVLDMVSNLKVIIEENYGK